MPTPTPSTTKVGTGGQATPTPEENSDSSAPGEPVPVTPGVTNQPEVLGESTEKKRQVKTQDLIVPMAITGVGVALILAAVGLGIWGKRKTSGKMGGYGEDA